MPIDEPIRGGDDARGVYAAGDIIVDKYELITPIAEGGMGSVWLARNQDLDADVAVKLIRRELAGSDDAAQRLLNEAQATASLDHPSIVTIHDFGETTRGDPYIVMEMLQGETLEETLEREEYLSVTHIVRLLLPIIDALHLAHNKGIVHRDLKPANIFLVDNEAGDTIPKLVDFGVAKLCYRDTLLPATEASYVSATHIRRVAQSITKTGTVLGSPQYMAPEQVRADPHIDGRADLWALCVVLYDAIVGERPFDDDDLEELLRSIMRDTPVPVTALGVDEPDLWEIVHRGLQKNVDERWPDARALGEALAAWLVKKDVHTDITGRSVFTKWLGHAANPSVPVEVALPVQPAQRVSWVGATVVVAAAVTSGTLVAWLGDDGAPRSPAAPMRSNRESTTGTDSPGERPALDAPPRATVTPRPSAGPNRADDADAAPADEPPRPLADRPERQRKSRRLPMPEVWDF